jgi:hypothetical protein
LIPSPFSDKNGTSTVDNMLFHLRFEDWKYHNRSDQCGK